MREVRREEGAVAVFRPGWSEIVASGALLERLHVTAGVYDVLVRAGDQDFSWPGVEIRGDLVATAGSNPPR